jgi:hypothetical protein
MREFAIAVMAILCAHLGIHHNDVMSDGITITPVTPGNNTRGFAAAVMAQMFAQLG